MLCGTRPYTTDGAPCSTYNAMEKRGAPDQSRLRPPSRLSLTQYLLRLWYVMKLMARTCTTSEVSWKGPQCCSYSEETLGCVSKGWSTYGSEYKNLILRRDRLDHLSGGEILREEREQDRKMRGKRLNESHLCQLSGLSGIHSHANTCCSPLEKSEQRLHGL